MWYKVKKAYWWTVSTSGLLCGFSKKDPSSLSIECKVGYNMFSRLKNVKETIRWFLNYIKEKRFYTGVSFAQNFEDLIFQELANNFRNGQIPKIYVDVGAHDPIRFSNTYRLYRNGWRGINIDPLPSCVDRFMKFRPDDINLNIGISSSKGVIEYYNFEEPAFNTLNAERANMVIENKYSNLVEKKTIQVDTLQNILDKYLTTEFDNNLQIGLLTLDVETMEMDVLKSNDWEKYRPYFIIMESIVNVNESLDKIYKDKAVQFLIELGYIAVAKVANAVFFKDSSK